MDRIVAAPPVVVPVEVLGILDYILETMPVVLLRHDAGDQQNGTDDENAVHGR